MMTEKTNNIERSSSQILNKVTGKYNFIRENRVFIMAIALYQARLLKVEWMIWFPIKLDMPPLSGFFQNTSVPLATNREKAKK